MKDCDPGLLGSTVLLRPGEHVSSSEELELKATHCAIVSTDGQLGFLVLAWKPEPEG